MVASPLPVGGGEFGVGLRQPCRLSQFEFVVRLICQSRQSLDAVAREVTVSVVDMSQSPDQYEIRGLASSSPRNFAYKVN